MPERPSTQSSHPRTRSGTIFCKGTTAFKGKSSAVQSVSRGISGLACKSGSTLREVLGPITAGNLREVHRWPETALTTGELVLAGSRTFNATKSVASGAYGIGATG